jgi:hypothetical protein
VGGRRSWPTCSRRAPPTTARWRRAPGELRRDRCRGSGGPGLRRSVARPGPGEGRARHPRVVRVVRGAARRRPADRTHGRGVVGRPGGGVVGDLEPRPRRRRSR